MKKSSLPIWDWDVMKALGVAAMQMTIAIAVGLALMVVAILCFDLRDDAPLLVFAVGFAISVIPLLRANIVVLGWILGSLAVLVIVLGLLFPAINDGHVVSRRQLAKMDVIHLSSAMKSYYAEFGHPINGEDAQIMSALMGQNPRGIVWFEPRKGSLNEKGQLIDPWGTPYRFDLSDPGNHRIWSCGKDRRDESGAEGSDDIPSWR